MSLGEDGLLRIVRALHEGAADPSVWGAALDLISEAFGGASLLLGTTPDGFGNFALAGHRMARESVALINGALANRVDNPVFRTVPRAPLNAPVVASERLSTAELTASAVYRQAMKPSGIHYVMTTVVDVVERGLVSFSLGRSSHQRDFEAYDAKLAAQLAPHIRTALRVRRQLDDAANSRADALVALDSLDRGVVLVSADGRIRPANCEAERMFAQADGLTYAGGRLGAVRPDDTLRLLMLVEATARGGPGGALPIRRASAAAGYAVQVAPFTLARATSVGAIVFMRDSAGDTTTPTELLSGLYGLSPAEAAIAGELLRGAGLREAAKALRISENTAKTQLKAVFEKVGVARQPQLARRISRDLVLPNDRSAR